MKFLKLNVKLISLISLGVFITCSFGSASNSSNGQDRAHTSATNLDPLGIWKSTGGMIRKGIRMLRDNLQEGVKIAQMLKEDMDDGIGHIAGKKEVKAESLSLLNSDGNGSGSRISAEDGQPQADSTIQMLAKMFTNQSKQFQQREGMLGGILRFVGFDSNSIGIIVLNVLIFIAEMVTSSLVGKESNSITDRRMLKTNVLEWLTTGRNAKIEHLFEEAQDKSLPENMIHLLQQRTGNRTSCVQLLLCKLKPFIWSVQKTVTNEINNSNSTSRANLNEKYIVSVWDQLNEVLPTKDNFISHGDDCEVKYPVCQLLKFQKNSKMP